MTNKTRQEIYKPHHMHVRSAGVLVDVMLRADGDDHLELLVWLSTLGLALPFLLNTLTSSYRSLRI